MKVSKGVWDFFHKGSFYRAAKPISIGAFGFCVFTITALSGCTFTRLYLICATGFKQNFYDFFGREVERALCLNDALSAKGAEFISSLGQRPRTREIKNDQR